ncbi:MAG: heme exporter protein CcmB [Chitinophagaceae bacterium]
MGSTKRILQILRKDFTLEWRQKYSIYGILLYLTCTVFAIKMMEEFPEGSIWNMLYWIIIMFVTVNAVAKSFLQEPKQRNIYYYTIHSAREVIAAKLIYNILLLILLSVLAFVLFILMLGFPVVKIKLFALMIVTGAFSFAVLFTMLSAIAGKAGGNAALIAILGFPLVIPQLIVLSDLSKPLIDTMQVTGWWKFYFILITLDILIIFLSYILFPYLWRE